MNNMPAWPGWETVKMIGRGSFGAVYEIQREQFGEIEKAAMKLISIPQNPGDLQTMIDNGYDEDSITATFNGHLKDIVSEYMKMSKLKGCANIVNCENVRYIQHDDGVGWDIFIKMELLTPLTKSLPAEIPEETVLKIAKDMCRALMLCGEHNIIHRDIKPQNMFVSPHGDYKLGDFGVAKTVEKTMGGTKIGTYNYMAPEVYNNQPYGKAADIYSLGLTLYWLLNKRRMPFMPLPPTKISAADEEKARYRRLTGETLPAPANGSDDLKRIVLKACAYDPRKRYSSAEEMLLDLEAVGKGTVRKKDKDKHKEKPEKKQKTKMSKKKRRNIIIIVCCILAASAIGNIGEEIAARKLAASNAGTQPDSQHQAEADPWPSLAPLPTIYPIGETDAPVQPTPEPLGLSEYSGSLADFAKVEFERASASSELHQGGVYFVADYAIDEESTRPWIEGVNGSGVGEILTLHFPTEQTFDILSLRLGYARTSELYNKNNRPCRLNFIFSDGSSVEYTFSDINEVQNIKFNRPITTFSIMVEILAVYRGSDDDTCIYQIDAYNSSEAAAPIVPSAKPQLSVYDPDDRDIIIGQISELYAINAQYGVHDEVVKNGDFSYCIKDGYVAVIIDKREPYIQYFYDEGEIRFIIIKPEEYSDEAMRLFLYDNTLFRAMDYQKNTYLIGDGSLFFRSMLSYEDAAVIEYSVAEDFVNNTYPGLLS